MHQTAQTSSLQNSIVVEKRLYYALLCQLSAWAPYVPMMPSPAIPDRSYPGIACNAEGGTSTLIYG
jgi:hypothetical protein